MKKIFSLFLIFILTSGFAQAQPEHGEQTKPNEIYLYDTGQKSYNLKKTDYRNNPKLKDNDDEDEMLFNITPAPLQLLKQYRDNNYD